MMNDYEKSLACFAVNGFGTGQTPAATPDNVHFFDEAYIKECLGRLINSPKVTEAAKKAAKELIEGDRL